MNILSWFKPQLHTGLLLDSPESIAELPRHELFFGAGLAKDWAALCPPFRYQGSSYWCTAYAGSSIASIFEKQESGKDILFSPMELFYRSNGQVFGNSLSNVATAVQDTVVLESAVPTVVPTSWGQTSYTQFKAISYATDQAKEFGRKYRLKTSAFVTPDKASLQSALAQSPLFIAIGIGKNYFADPAPRQSQYSAYHAVVLTGIDKDGNYVIFDSLTQTQSFNGFHKLAPDYEILAAISFIDLPDNWEETQTTANAVQYPGALKQYGKKRILMDEKSAADDLTRASKTNPTLSAYVGRDFLVYVNALAYGRYSVQDILNHLTSIRRGKGPIFDFNKMK